MDRQGSWANAYPPILARHALAADSLTIMGLGAPPFVRLNENEIADHFGESCPATVFAKCGISRNEIGSSVMSSESSV
jgi:hypothetical protein